LPSPIFLASPVVAEQGLITAQPALHTVKLTGFTRARRVLTLSTETSGRVEQVFVDIGDSVPEKAYFCCLDATYIDLEIESNRIEGKRLEAEFDYYKKQVERYRQLVKTNSTAQSQLDEFERHLSGFRQQIEANRVQDRILSERKQRHCISAPADWRVIERYVEPGQWLNAGGPVGQVGDYTRLLIPFALTSAEYQAALHNADRLKLHLVDLDLTVPARIERVSPAFDEQSRKIKLDLQISAGSDFLRGGLRTELTLRLPPQSGAVLVPAETLEQRYEEYWLQRTNGEEVKVEYLGLFEDESFSGRLVEVASPEVHPGDQFRLRHKDPAQQRP
jgi:RND family efflux transporter MFP subunit